MKLKLTDPLVYGIIQKEYRKQLNKINLIASENYTSQAVREAVSSVLMNKYSEGYPGKRYYEGNYYIDALEDLTISRVKKAFKLGDDYGVNVQALSGSIANLVVYNGVLSPGDTILSMYLPAGGHLSHGWSINKDVDISDDIYMSGKRKTTLVSKLYNVVQYKLNPRTDLLDYEILENALRKFKPKLVITGGTAYPREIDYAKVADIVHKHGSLYMADVAHEAGLIVAGVNKSPVGSADIITMTTHKTLRCNRGAIIIAKNEHIKDVNRSLFPGIQGGPHNHSIAGICVGLKEAMSNEFKIYAHDVVENAKALADKLMEKGFRLVSGGTDKHLILVNLTNKPVLGAKYAKALDIAGIIVNKNTMPKESRSPSNPSAIRIGTPSVSTRGMKEKEMHQIAVWMDQVMNRCASYNHLSMAEFITQMSIDPKIINISKEVELLCKKYPFEK